MAYTANDVLEIFEKRAELAEQTRLEKRAKDDEYVASRVTAIVDLLHEFLMVEASAGKIAKLKESDMAETLRSSHQWSDRETFIIPKIQARTTFEFVSFLDKNDVALQKEFCKVDGWGGFELYHHPRTEGSSNWDDNNEHLQELWDTVINKHPLYREGDERGMAVTDKKVTYQAFTLVFWTKPRKPEMVPADDRQKVTA